MEQSGSKLALCDSKGIEPETILKLAIFFRYDILCAKFDLNPDLLVYLKTDPKVAFNRMVSRGR